MTESSGMLVISLAWDGTSRLVMPRSLCFWRWLHVQSHSKSIETMYVPVLRTLGSEHAKT